MMKLFGDLFSDHWLLLTYILMSKEQPFSLIRFTNLCQGASTVSLRKQSSFFAPDPSVVSIEGHLQVIAENSMLMT